jgi:prolyl 4-hydroxylase
VPKKLKEQVVQPLGDRQTIYDDFLSSCVKSFGSKGQRCVGNERERIAMSLRQPQSMTNYTDVGFKKIRAPPEVFKLVQQFWEANKGKQTPENWGTGNTYSEFQLFVCRYEYIHMSTSIHEYSPTDFITPLCFREFSQ